jgi:squalene-hopene/tetraprenyl-beta-curcumene cyclase
MMISKLYDSVQSALLSASCYSNNVFLPDGNWWGECITNVTPTAEYVLLHQAFGLDIESEKDAICKYLLSEQRADGSWATAFGNPGNVTCTVEAYIALKILGIPAGSEAMCRARDFVISHGGIASTSMFTRVVLAG